MTCDTEKRQAALEANESPFAGASFGAVAAGAAAGVGVAAFAGAAAAAGAEAGADAEAAAEVLTPCADPGKLHPQTIALSWPSYHWSKDNPPIRCCLDWAGEGRDRFTYLISSTASCISA